MYRGTEEAEVSEREMGRNFALLAQFSSCACFCNLSCNLFLNCFSKSQTESFHKKRLVLKIVIILHIFFFPEPFAMNIARNSFC